MHRSPRAVLFAYVAWMAAAVPGTPQVAAQSPADNPLAVTQNGVSLNRPGAYEGYSLIAPMNSTSTYLVDLQGRIVREWQSDYTPALSAYLLENGHLLRPAVDRGAKTFDIPAVGGRIQEFDWDGQLVWDFVLELDGVSPHHDICPLPNGNVLVIATEGKTKEEVLAIGRKPESLGNRLLVDCVLEIQPTGLNSGEIVWQWHAWDHLVQDTDETKPKYGEVSEHPELIDVNYGSRAFAAMTADPQQLAQLRGLGYVGGGANPQTPPGKNGSPDAAVAGGRPRGPGIDGDWMHTNSIAYNAALDQIVLSVHGFSEVWIIDHGTTTAEAASHSGGKRGHGGDLLYRWGNPQAYRNGSKTDQRLFGQHCAYWIPDGLSGAGRLMVFNNGMGRTDGSYSSVDEIELPLRSDGTYEREEFLAFGPDRAAWSYTAPDKASFNSMLISGAQRLPNGNTFVCSGNQGMLFEVSASGEIVWVYKHPGAAGFGFPGMNGRMGMFPDFVRRMLNVDDAQGEKLTALQADVDQRLADILTEEQRKRMEQPPMFGRPPGGGGPPAGGPPAGGPPPGGRRGFRPPRFGEVIPFFVVGALELSNEQESQVGNVQEHVDTELKLILTDAQREQIENMARAFARGLGGGPPGGGPPPGTGPDNGGPSPAGDGPPRGGPDRGGPMFGGPGGPGGGPGRGPGGIFRCYRYGPDYAGLAGKDLTPGESLAEVAEKALRPPEGGSRREPTADEPSAADGRNP